MDEPHPTDAWPNNGDATNPTPTSATAAAQRWADSGSQCGRFSIQAIHARGGIGEVHVARDCELDRDVALKRMQDRWSDNATARRRFLNEAAITARLEHPGIVPIYGLVADENGRPCYAMRFIQGATLAEAIRPFHRPDRGASTRANRFEFRKLLQRFVSVCQTIAFAHSKGVVHRDLKPANIMLGPFGETLVVDWGLAKETGAGDKGQGTREDCPPSEPTNDGRGVVNLSATPSTNVLEQTEQGSALGTPAYMSPEQAAGQWDKVGPASDIYSLGAILYEMLAGRPPAQGANLEEVMQNARDGKFVPPRTIRTEVPRPLEAVVLKALAHRPEDRYAAALDLAADVEHWLADEPVIAYQEPWTVRLRRWRRRHRPLVSAGVASLAVATILLGALVGVVTAKNADLSVAMAQTLAARDRARSTIEAVTSEGALEALARQGKLSKEQETFLQSMVGYYQDFAQESATSEQERERQGRAFFRMGAMLVKLGRGAEGESAYRRSAAVRQQLVAAYPAVAEYRRSLAKTHNNLGVLLKDAGRRDEALTEHQLALKLQEDLVVDFPRVPEYRQDLAGSLLNMGVLLSSQRKPADAEADFRRAVLLFEQLADEFPDKGEYREDLAKSLNNLGMLLREQGKLKEAEAAHRQALGIRERLVAQSPESAENRQSLAASRHNLADLLADKGETDRARELYGEAIALKIRLASEFPNVPSHAVDLGGSYLNLGNLLHAQKQYTAALDAYDKGIATLEPVVTREAKSVIARHTLRNASWGRAESLDRLHRYAEAVHEWDRAIVLAEGSSRAMFERSRALALVRTGAHKQAAAVAAKLATDSKQDGEALLELAAIYSLATAAATEDADLREKYAACAITLIGRARANGYKDWKHLKTDERFEPLRQRDDFKRLIDGNVTDEKGQ